MEKIIIRNASVEDAKPLSELSKELGYEISDSQIHAKLKKFALDKNEKVIVAEEKKVIGWIHLSIVEPLESKKILEIRGMIVTENYQRKGVGTKLLSEAENWAKLNGISKLRVRTNIVREETIEYYKRLSFSEIKQQMVFEKYI